MPDTVMSGATWARCLAPPKLGDSSAAAELGMAAVATNEVIACQMQARELGHGPRAPTPLYLDATAVPHGTATEQVSREMKYPAAKLAIVQQARAHGKIQTMKIDESMHPAGILTKPLQGREIVYKRARVLGLEGSGAAAAEVPASGGGESKQCYSGAGGDPRRLCCPPPVVDDVRRGGHRSAI